MNIVGWTRIGSIRFRLVAATMVATLIALVLSGFFLAASFQAHVLSQFQSTLTSQLDLLTAQLDFDEKGQPQLDTALLTDPRWSRPYSGLYWQVDPDGPVSAQRGVLRSRSLWDTTLGLTADELADGAVHVHEIEGPKGARLLAVERTVRSGGGGAPAWRLIVAADLKETRAAAAHFNGELTWALAVLMLLMGAAALAQVAVGLAPLRVLQRALAAVHQGSRPDWKAASPRS